MNSPFNISSPFFNQNNRYNPVNNISEYYHPNEDYCQYSNNNENTQNNSNEVDFQIKPNKNENSNLPYQILMKYQTALNNNYIPNGYSLRQYKTFDKNTTLMNSINMEDNHVYPNSNKINNPQPIIQDNCEIKNELNSFQNPQFNNCDLSDNINANNNINDTTQNNNIDMDIEDNNFDKNDAIPSTETYEDKSANIDSGNDVIIIKEFSYKKTQHGKKENKEILDNDNKTEDGLLKSDNDKNINDKITPQISNKKWFAMYKGCITDLMMKYLMYNNAMDDCNKQIIDKYAIGSNEKDTIFYFEIKEDKTFQDINVNSFHIDRINCEFFPADDYIFLEKQCNNKYLYYSNMEYFNELNNKISEQKNKQEINAKDKHSNSTNSNIVNNANLNNISNNKNYFKVLWISEPKDDIRGYGEFILYKYVKNWYEITSNINWDNYSNEKCVVIKIRKNDNDYNRNAEIFDLLNYFINNSDKDEDIILSKIKFLIVICEKDIYKLFVKDVDKYYPLFCQIQYFNLIDPNDLESLEDFVAKNIRNK